MTSEPEDRTGEPDEPGPEMRASDADRHATVSRLQDAMARGLLSLDETDERIKAAYASRFRSELPRLTADLPSAPAVVPTAPGWRPLTTMALQQVRLDLSGGPAGAHHRRRLVVALVLAVLFLSLVLMSLHGLNDGGPDHFRGGFDGH
jgi:hypothetical protein